MKAIVVAVAFLMILSSLVLFGISTQSASGDHALAPALPNTVVHKLNGQTFPTVNGQSNGMSNASSSSYGHASAYEKQVGGIRLFPGSMVQSNNSTANLSRYYSITLDFGTMPFDVFNGSWYLYFWLNRDLFYFMVGPDDYTGSNITFQGFSNGSYSLSVYLIPYPYYQVSYPSVIVVNGSNETVGITFPVVSFEFEVYVVGIPQMSGLGLWTDYVGMNAENISFPPFIDMSAGFFAYSTAQNFAPSYYSLMGGYKSQAMVEAELQFYGAAGDHYFQYNVSLLLTNATIIGGADPAIVFNVTFHLTAKSDGSRESLTGLYLPSGAVFDNVSLSFTNAPGQVWWNNAEGSYGGVTYGRFGFTQADLSLYNAGNTIGALNSLMSPDNGTGLSTFAFGWSGLYGGSPEVVGAFIPEYGTAVIPGFYSSAGGLFSSLASGYSIPSNISGISNATIVLNSSDIYTFYNDFYPYYAYYDYYPALQEAINVTQSAVDNSPYLSSNLMNFLPVREGGMAVGGWGWNLRWAYPVFYPSSSYYGTNIAGLPKWMGTPYVFSDINESSSMAYLLGNYKNVTYSFELYFINNGTVSPPWGGGETNVSGLVNGSLPFTNLSYWMTSLEHYSRSAKGFTYPYYSEGWTPYLVINTSLPYYSPSVEFYSGAEAVTGVYLDSNTSVRGYTYYDNGSYYWKSPGWQYSNSTYVVRLFSFGPPTAVSSMYGVMRNDYVIAFNNSSSNSITPFAVNYSNLPNGAYGGIAGYPSEYSASYVQNARSSAEGAGESGSVNYLSFGTFRYVLSYALYPYPVPMVYAINGTGNGTYSSSNPFNYFSFHSYGNETVFNVSTVGANYSISFNFTDAVGSTTFLSCDNLTSPFAIDTNSSFPFGEFAQMSGLNSIEFWHVYRSTYYPKLESGNYSFRMAEPNASVSTLNGWTNVNISNNQSEGVYIYLGFLNQGNYSVSDIMHLIGELENSTTSNAQNSSGVGNVTVNSSLTQQQLSSLMHNISIQSFGSEGAAILHIGYNNFSFSLNERNGTLFVDIPVNGTVTEFKFFNVSQIFYVYYVGVFGYLDSYISSTPSKSASSTSIPLWVFGIIPAALLVAVILHDFVNWLMGGVDKDSIFFWRNIKKGDQK